MITKFNLTFTHCCYCDSFGKAPYDDHPMLTRLRELGEAGKDDGMVDMVWQDCKECIADGGEQNTKVIVECEFNEPFEMV